MDQYKGGFHEEPFLNSREQPFGSLAKRVIGDLHGEMDSPRYGLEMSFDSVLRGKPGLRHIKRVSRTNLSVVDEVPVDGDDIVTTINMRIQDIAEAALVKELKLINGETGVAIVMDVETGDIKAMVNMERMANGEYGEIMSHAISDLLEPGSVFKTASLMVALDDGVVDTSYTVDTGSGIYHMHTRDMKDHNWRKGGYGRLSVPRILQVSSNIGVSRIIDENYSKNPERFVDGIYRLGLADDLHLPLPGYAKPIIKKPKRNSHGKLVDWPLTKLPWMSIGYETQIPPISMVTFYNAIANNGRMMRPRIVKAVMRDGKVIREYPTEVMREQICKPTTLSKIRTMLEQVVSIGLGKQAGSQSFVVAGKTGTAQISKGRGGYTSGTVNYLLSFAGYFPAEKPKYTCIVCIRKSGLPASGGGMSGVVFHDIAEGIMAHYLKVDASQSCDTTESLLPKVKKGDLKAADFVLTNLGYRSSNPGSMDSFGETEKWGTISFKDNIFLFNTNNNQKNIMPDVTGSGARDAVYQLERLGLKTHLEGRGKVASQSIPAGNKIHKGQTCILTLK
jgi:cell division protein FtsI (penicillin-binding protein 3)